MLVSQIHIVRQKITDGCDFFSRHPVMRRILAGLVVRPWLIDIGCGIAAMQWGFWVAFHHKAVEETNAFVRFNPVIRELAIAAFLFGAIQLCAALLKMTRTRQVIALLKVTLWFGIASGISGPSGQAAYAGYALLDVMILLRAY